MDIARTANLLGTFATAAHHRIMRQIGSQPGMGGEGPAAIVCIGNHPGQTVGFLANALELTHSGTVRLVDRLEAEKLVQRRTGEDRRAVALHLTKSGQTRMAQILKARRNALTSLLAALPSKERRLLDPVLENLLRELAKEPGASGSICRLCDTAACPHDACPLAQELQQD